jgi:hypothetical protein
VLDRTNPQQVQAIDASFVYQATREFIRKKNLKKTSGGTYWTANMTPKNSGVAYYDTWFKNYYSDYEQTCNLQSYYDSVKYTCGAKCISFFFSKESTTGLVHNDNNFALDFIINNQLNISSTNMHFNELGHSRWCDHLHKQL